MNNEIDRLMENPYLETLAFCMVAGVAMILFLSVFELLTRYSVSQEIKKGNLSVAMATGGKMFGICNIIRFAMQNNETVFHVLLWSGFGFVILLAAYFVFEFLTPYYNIDDEIRKDNKAVGFIAMMLSVALSYVIGASII